MVWPPSASRHKLIASIFSYKNALTNDMRQMYGFLRLASRLANPFGHPSQVRTQVLLLQTCVDLRRLASPFGQGFIYFIYINLHCRRSLSFQARFAGEQKAAVGEREGLQNGDSGEGKGVKVTPLLPLPHRYIYT